MRKQTSVRVEEKFYLEALKVFKSMGLTFGDAVNLFLAKVSMEKKIPFEIGYSEELIKRVENIEKEKNIEIFDSFEELLENINL